MYVDEVEILAYYLRIIIEKMVYLVQTCISD